MDINSLNTFLENPTNQIIFVLLAIWSLIWKGIALWKAAHHDQRNWFIAMLIINSFGILEIIYIFYFQKKDEKKLNEEKVEITKNKS